MTQAEFIEFCKQLRELGATAVHADGDKFTAHFAPAVKAVAVEREPRRAQPEPEPDNRTPGQIQRDAIMQLAGMARHGS